MSKTVRLTTAQAIVKFLDQQYVSRDGEETKFVEAFFTLFGHGIAVEDTWGEVGPLDYLRERFDLTCDHIARVVRELRA